LIQVITDEWARLLSRYGTTRVTASFILVVAVLLRLPNLDESLWYDEVLYSTRFVANSLPKLWELVFSDPPAPLYRYVLYGWAGLFGENDIVARIPSFICGVAAIFLTYAMAKKYGDIQAAFLAALFLCFSPTHVWYSQEATPYAMTLCFLLATVLVWKELKSGTRPGHWYFFYGLFLICAIFTQFFAAVYLLPLTVLTLDASPVAWKRIIAINLVTGALAVSMLAIKYQVGRTIGVGQSFLRPFTLVEWWMLFFNWFLHGNALWTLPPWATLQDLIRSPLLVSCQIFFLVILVRGLLPPRGKIWDKLSLELLLFLIAPPLTMSLLTLAGYQKIYIERYLLIGLPFFAIVLARGVTAFAHRYVTGIATAAVVMLGVTSYAMFLSKSDEWTVYKQNPDMRGAARYLAAQNISADDAIIVFPTYEAVSLSFYIDQVASQNHAIVQTQYDPATVEQAITTGKLKEIYVVTRGDRQRVDGFFAANPRLVLRTISSFKGMHVYTFVPVTIPTKRSE